jgi:hypothetical protein
MESACSAALQDLDGFAYANSAVCRLALIDLNQAQLRCRAGTINPLMPKRIIASASIVDWIEEGYAK